MIGCDTGGTFTDFVMFDPRSPERGLCQLKLSSTPDDPSRAVLEGLKILSGGDPISEVNHATTVATNALLERTGGRVVLFTTQGFEDIPWLGRGTRSALYELRPQRTSPPLSPEDVRGVLQRHDCRGQTIVELQMPSIEDIEADAVAISFLHAPVNPEHEKQCLETLSECGIPCFASHQLSPTAGEYERTMTCLTAAYLAPKVRDYITKLSNNLANSKLWIVHSAGGRLTPDEACDNPHRLALSGPAAGLRGALALADSCGEPTSLVTLDMGGTSTDVALCNEELPYVWEMDIEGTPVRAPSLEIHTIGAGGGSLAYVDGGGFLRVGPRSAGARPGPACYGRGGLEATVTDALCYAGYLPETLGDEKLPLKSQASETALEGLAERLGVTTEEAALGILDLAVAHLGRAVRKVSTGRGHDPQRFTLFPFGGAGPILACAVADSLEMSRILIPHSAGVLSAWGALNAPWEREWSETVPLEIRKDADAVAARLLALISHHATEDVNATPLVTRRYLGQGEGLTSSPDTDFHQLHRERFGFARPDCEVEWVEIRVRLRRTSAQVSGDSEAIQSLSELGERQLLAPSGRSLVPAFAGTFARGQSRAGPFLLFSVSSTLFVAPGWTATGLVDGNLRLERSS